MENSILVGKIDGKEVGLNLAMANRHGLVAGATGTGKTVTLQTLTHGFSQMGVPVFLADVKGDLSGMAKAGSETAKTKERLSKLNITDFCFADAPVEFWDVFGKQGHPARCTISDIGPLLLARMLNLNEVQEGVLQVLFKIADEKDLLLLDFKDLNSMVQFVSENASEISKTYGQVAPSSLGAIQRALVGIEAQGAAHIFGEPMLNILDFIKTDSKGRGQVNILAADQLMRSPKVYAIFLLWMLSELFENLPEAGDLKKPKIVFFFDEAHLLFSDSPKVLVDKIEQVVRLIRSKGVGVYFVTQNPLDIPESVLGQLSNRVQHALRAFTPKDQKAVKSVAETMRANPQFKTEAVITELGVGEALASFLDASGVPAMVERTLILPPPSQIGPIAADEIKSLITSSPMFDQYQNVVDRESAFEKLEESKKKNTEKITNMPTDKPTAPRGGRPRQSVGEAVLKSTARTIGNEIGRQVIRGILGSLMGRR